MNGITVLYKVWHVELPGALTPGLCYHRDVGVELPEGLFSHTYVHLSPQATTKTRHGKN